MVGRRVLRVLKRQVNGLHQAAYLLAVFAFLSQLLGLVRDRLLAHYFGAGIALDTYYASFRIPDLIFAGLASLVSVFIILPILTNEREKGVEHAKRFLTSVSVYFFGAVALVSMVAFVVAPLLLKILFPVIFELGSGQELIALTRIILLSPILLGMSNLFASVTQMGRHFLVYAVAPILYNAGIIIGIIFFLPWFGLRGLAAGVVLGALFHLLIGMPIVFSSGFAPSLRIAPSFAHVRYVLSRALPRTLTLSINQVLLLGLIALSSRVSQGSVSVFTLSFNLQSVPLAIIGASYSVAAFPTLSRLFVRGDQSAFAQQVGTAIRHILFWSIPAVVLFIVLRAQIVRTVLGSGAFTWDDTRLTAAALALFVFSVAAQSLVTLLIRAYYAAGKTFIPFAVSSISAGVTIVISFWARGVYNNNDMARFFLESLLRVADIGGTGVLVYPLAYSIGMLCSVVFLYSFFIREFGKVGDVSIKATFFHSFSASILSGFVAYLLLNIFDDIFDLNTFWGIFGQGLFAGIGGLLFCALMLWVLRNKEFAEAVSTARSAFWKSHPVPIEQEEL